MRILITGATGLLGPYLMTAFSSVGEVTGISSADCDLTDEGQVKAMLASRKPEIIVHAAAWTDVDGCEQKPNVAVVRNAGMTENLVQNMPEGCRFIYISTDMIYSGYGPHREHSKSENPINMYGMSKFMGEFAAAKTRNHLIVRTNMYGKALSKRKSSLVDFFLNHMKNGDIYNAFTDSIFNPLWTKTLADKLVVMAKANVVGAFNLGASTAMSKAKFAMLLADGMGLSAQGIRPMVSTAMPGRAVRPLDTTMDTSRTWAAFGLTTPTMEADIKAMCEIIRCTN